MTLAVLQVALGVVVVAIGISLLAFWVWMLVECLRTESNENHDKLVWTLLILFTKLLGAALYYFLRYRKRDVSLHRPAINGCVA